MRVKRFIFLLVFLVQACIDPFVVKLENAQPLLIVDGMITDQPGPYTVKLSRSLPIDDQLDESLPVKAASVTIYDDAGTVEKLSEVIPGTYQTSTIQGTIGRTYHIEIATTERDTYTSVPEKLLPVGSISKLYESFKLNQTTASIDPFSSPNGFDIFIDSEILPEQNGLVRWRWTGTFEIKTYPELQTKIVVVGGNQLVFPDPPRCSGFIIDPADRTKKSVKQVDECTCCNCWVTQYNEIPLISDPKFIAGNTVTGFQLDFLQATRRYFFDKYYFEVEQMSTSQVVYDFWKKVAQQKENGSNLFQTPPPKTLGNIQTTSENSVSAVGVFAAAAVKKQQLVILRSDVPYNLPLMDTIAFSCTGAYKRSVPVKPAFW